MRSKKIKVCSLVLATAVCSTLFGVPHKAESATIKNGIVYITESDVKNGKVTIKDTNAKSIIVKKSVKKATIQLNNVKLSGGLSFEKGNFVLKTKKTSVNSLKISGKNTKIKLDKASDLNNKNITLTVAKNTTGNIDLTSFSKNVNVNLGENTDFKLAIGKKDSAKVTIKKAHESSVFEVGGKGEGSKVSKITVESPVVLVVNVDTTMLETKKAAAKASITVLRSADQIKNEGKAEIKEAFNETENSKADTVKDNNIKEENSKESTPSANTGGGLGGGNLGGGGGSLGGGGNLGGGGGGLGGGGNLGGGGGSLDGGSSVPQKPATSIEFVTTDFNIKENTGEITVQVKYLPEGSIGKIEWDIKGKVGGKTNTPNVAGIVSSTDKGTIESIKSGETIKIRALNNGTYKISAKLEGKPATYISKEGQVEGQKVKLAAGTPANYKAEDGKITGVESGNQYILISGNKYYGVAADGRASGSLSTRGEALSQIGTLIGNEITGLDNSKTYTIEKLDAAKEADRKLIEKYEDYMSNPKYNEANITFKVYNSYLELSDKGNKLVNELEKRLDTANSDKAEWQERFNKAKERAEAVNRKTTANKALVENAKNEIAKIIEDLNGVNNSDESRRPNGSSAKDIIEAIDRELAKVQGVIYNYVFDSAQLEIYNNVKEEVKIYDKLVKGTGVLSFNNETKVLTLPKQVVNVKGVIKKDKGNNQWEKTLFGEIPAGTENFDMKLKLNGLGAGKYVIEVYKEFHYIRSEFIDSKGGVEVDIN